MRLGRTFDALLGDVWDACTNPERLPRWFLPVSGELQVGGHYQLEGNAGGTIERCDPPDSFAGTWEYGGGVSWIEVRLSAQRRREPAWSSSTSRLSTTGDTGSRSVRAPQESDGISD